MTRRTSALRRRISAHEVAVNKWDQMDAHAAAQLIAQDPGHFVTSEVVEFQPAMKMKSVTQ